MTATIAAAPSAPVDPRQHLATVPSSVEDDYAPARFRRRYERAATNGAWGHEWGTCGRMTIVRREGNVLTLTPALCDCWACELCGVRRAAWLKAQLGRAQPLYGLDYFMTLTLWTESCTAPESFRFIKGAWHTCHRSLTKAHGHFPYVWTVEATKRGYAHLHFLSGLDVPRVELSHRWKLASGGSWRVDVQPVASERAANYLAKYCVEQATLRREPGWEELRYQKQFSKSRDVQFEPFRSPGDGASGTIALPYWDAAAKLRNTATVVSERVQGIPRLVVEVPT